MTARAEYDPFAAELFISETFQKNYGFPPVMGWMIPPNEVVAAVKLPAIFVFSNEGYVKATFVRELKEKEVKEINYLTMLCYKGQVYYLYKIKGKFKQRNRAFYTKKKISGVKMGYKKVVLSEKTLKLSRSAMKSKPDDLHKYFAITSADGKKVYSFHGLYQSKSKNLRKQAMILHDSKGIILALEETIINENNLCDGCGIPTFSHDLRRSFHVLNTLTIPKFPYPLALLNTSSIEQSAISLMTFDLKRKHSEYRTSEYTVNCLPE